ncbi:unnamed protein product [Paramecium pentaurelia]|uniref:Uncharacterized protein n=1 Tax=Paramecium pentaurelia TaxID=43138 RepID=A0A8S1SMT8_9CILI|nr:unnamed protein product [Paramecium pentaurelia]
MVNGRIYTEDNKSKILTNVQLQKAGHMMMEENEIKIGTWFELSEFFYENSQVFYLGEYQNVESESGGGSYDEGGKETKIGKWIDLDNQFQNENQITCN